MGANQYGPYGPGGSKEIKLGKNQSTNFDFKAVRNYKKGTETVAKASDRKAISQIVAAAKAKGYKVSENSQGINRVFKRSVLVHTFKFK